MNKLEQLFKSKEEIDRQIEAEKQAKIDKDQKIANERLQQERLIQQNSMDGSRCNTLQTEYFDKITEIIGNDITPQDLAFLFAVLLHVSRNSIDTREIWEYLDSYNRVIKAKGIK